ncbi:hypothetical protein GQ464_012330 [Rhodocaloribacter litoris]|uniref:hypothetical protein n=1 Tax=Rhodocaloribacter litoris TaxID=2558931 RepID=UPI0014222EBA|nr:hypothetical protein [Rhodocaloribacter litoris]QXD14234.1 hypothetical protein GQ464_012330 [Rhodocaloribacter litoris]
MATRRRLVGMLAMCVLAGPVLRAGAQEAPAGLPVHGAVSVTNKGISFVPAFSLGRPAVVFNGSAGRRLRFEPELRFALEDGTPWSFLFWWRYDLHRAGRWQVRLGMHPALSFTNRTVETGSGTEEMIVARRFLAGELATRYAIGPHLTAGVYYLYAYGFEPTVPTHNHFLSFQPGLNGALFGGRLRAGVNPQVYYLRLDDEDGVYVASTLSLGTPALPVSLGVLVNKIIDTRIAGSEDWLWNVSLVYAWRF